MAFARKLAMNPSFLELLLQGVVIRYRAEGNWGVERRILFLTLVLPFYPGNNDSEPTLLSLYHCVWMLPRGGFTGFFEYFLLQWKVKRVLGQAYTQIMEGIYCVALCTAYRLSEHLKICLLGGHIYQPTMPVTVQCNYLTCVWKGWKIIRRPQIMGGCLISTGCVFISVTKE